MSLIFFTLPSAYHFELRDSVCVLVYELPAQNNTLLLPWIVTCEIERAWFFVLQGLYLQSGCGAEYFYNELDYMKWYKH